MDLKSFSAAVMEIADERGIPEERIFDIIEEAIASAYKKEYGRKKQKIVARLDKKTGELFFWQVKQVVTSEMLLTEEEIQELREKRQAEGQEGQGKRFNEEELEVGEGEEKKIRFNPERHILLEEALAIDKNIKVNEELRIPLEAKEDFGRIAAQTAKQVILQKIREVEKDEAFREFSEKEGEVVSGIVQRVEKSAVFFDIGRAIGVLPFKEQIPNEFYRVGQRLKMYLLKTEQSPKGPMVVLSRIYHKLISKLFELEVPEIGAGQVIVRAIAREAGSRSKVAVSAEEEGIDPIGALVGQRGTRINAVINELGGEKIDIILWNEKPEKFLANALSPAKVLEVRVLPKNRAQVIIPDDQLSLAIGKEGQNVRLAAKLTGWKIDVRSLAQFEQDKKDGKLPFADEDEEGAPEAGAEPESEPETQAENTDTADFNAKSE